ncbi:MAG: 3-hydroxyacyl-CoA dehydrogenase family protein [Thermoleophilia bacterium]|nr:3-hydroxyacyl-CoA dehydrogenase family protein [Thermoleophilia bacterium]
MTQDKTAIAVVGSGLMGHSIAQVLALAGHRVAVHDADAAALASVPARVQRNLGELVRWGMVDAADAAATVARLSLSSDLPTTVTGAEFVFEAIWENLAAKRQLFGELDRLCLPETILASNSSSLMPSLLQSDAEHPERILVAHFFNPPYLVPLVEVVKGARTSDDTVNRVYELLVRAGRTPVLVRKEVPGFLANRMQLALVREAIHLVEEGVASPEDVDLAVQAGFGRRFCVAGPMGVTESIGWDLAVAVLNTTFPSLDNRMTAGSLAEGLIERGELGMKTGRGLLRWTDESVEAWRSRMARALVELERNEAFRP